MPYTAHTHRCICSLHLCLCLWCRIVSRVHPLVITLAVHHPAGCHLPHTTWRCPVRHNLVEAEQQQKQCAAAAGGVDVRRRKKRRREDRQHSQVWSSNSSSRLCQACSAACGHAGHASCQHSRPTHTPPCWTQHWQESTHHSCQAGTSSAHVQQGPCAQCIDRASVLQQGCYQQMSGKALMRQPTPIAVAQHSHEYVWSGSSP